LAGIGQQYDFINKSVIGGAFSVIAPMRLISPCPRWHLARS
jgi:hypothetical protein